ncbi:hypothetical protein [Celeribacter naphthalenivorans]|uniref:hypothetical protein n=1 Tax=Celeribacter naphthalenivorans TaxID=1614694 RepID=UPI001CFA3242|nr:hypothetical protein [Celeribacter naphthalenivorans]
MKPNFALNLSHDGIVLLHRASSGWHQMGEVALDAPDMAAELAELRKLATSVSTSGLATKLVIPNSQILYRSLPDPGEASRDAAIRAALDGATPYAVDELVWDSTVTNGQVQVAVIARETLEEAESFATEHRFNPVSFVALPEAETYAGEPFFGRAKAADALIGAGTKVEPDESAIHILPKRKLPPPPVDPMVPVAEPLETLVEPPAETSVEEAPLEVRSNVPEGLPEDLPADEPEDAPQKELLLEQPPQEDEGTAQDLPDRKEAELGDDAADEPLGEAPDAPLSETQDEKQDEIPAEPQTDTAKDAESTESEVTEAELTKAEIAPTEDTPPEAPAPSGFQSRRLTATEAASEADATAAPRLSARPARFSAVSEDDTPAHKPLGPAAPAPTSGNTQDTSAEGPQSVQKPVQEHPHVAVTSGDLPVEELDEAPKPKAPRPGKSAPLPEPPPMPASPLVPEPRALTSPQSGTLPGPLSGTQPDKKAPKTAAKQAAKGALKSLSGLSTAAKTRMDKAKDDRAKKEEAKKEAADKAATLSLQNATNTGIAPDMAPMSDRAAGLDRVENTLDEAEALTVFGARRSSRTDRRSPRMGLILTGILVVALLLIGLVVGMLPEDNAQPESTQTSAETSALEQADETSGDLVDLSDETVVIPDTALADGSEAATDEAALEDEPELTPELLEQAALPEPPGVQNELPEPDLEALNAQYAATGIWPLAPNNGTGETGEDDLNAVYTASIDPRISSQDAGALPDPARHIGEPAPRAALQPAPPGTRYDYDEDGFIRATPEGTVTPDGTVVYAGRPDIVSKPRPGSAVEEAVEAALAPAQVDENDPVRLALAAFQPKLRPESLVENTEKANLGGMTRAELGGFAPTLRPASAQELAEEDARTETPDAQPRTAPVVAVSLIPKARPQDFEKLAAAARAAEAAAAAAAEAGTTQTSAATQVTARVPDSPLPKSDPANVARAATVKNAISLRKLNLMGVYGSSSDRRALVRLPSGRFAKVKIGDKLDGGRVQSIGSDSLVYVKNGRSVTLEIQG